MLSTSFAGITPHLSQKYQDCIAICQKFDVLPNLATTTSNTKLHILKTHNLSYFLLKIRCAILTLL
jgi:hypothetical protein